MAFEPIRLLFVSCSTLAMLSVIYNLMKGEEELDKRFPTVVVPPKRDGDFPDVWKRNEKVLNKLSKSYLCNQILLFIVNKAHKVDNGCDEALLEADSHNTLMEFHHNGGKRRGSVRRIPQGNSITYTIDKKKREEC